MKKTIKITAVIALALITSLFTACKQEQKESDNAENIKELKSEVEDLNIAINNLANTENEAFKEEAFKIIDNFNHQILTFENQLKESNDQLDDESQQSLDELKTSMKNIEAKLMQLDYESQESFADIKSEINHDFTEFGKSVKNFFNDNITN